MNKKHKFKVTSPSNIAVWGVISYNFISFIWLAFCLKYYSALTVDDEKRQIGNLISGFVKKVDYGRDFEQQLSFYVEARSAFPNLDSVHAQLVQVS